jgi:hypothetical protein
MIWVVFFFFIKRMIFSWLFAMIKQQTQGYSWKMKKYGSSFQLSSLIRRETKSWWDPQIFVLSYVFLCSAKQESWSFLLCFSSLNFSRIKICCSKHSVNYVCSVEYILKLKNLIEVLL